MTAENEWRQQKEKTVENKMRGENYVRKSVICKAQFFLKTYIQYKQVKDGQKMVKWEF